MKHHPHHGRRDNRGSAKHVSRQIHKRRANADGHRHQQGEAAYGDAQAHPSVRHSPLLGRNPGTKSCKDAPYTDRDENKGIGDIGHEDDGSNRHE